MTLANATNKSPAGFGVVLKRADGTIFDTTGSNSTAAVVLGMVTCHLSSTRLAGRRLNSRAIAECRGRA